MNLRDQTVTGTSYIDPVVRAEMIRLLYGSATVHFVSVLAIPITGAVLRTVYPARAIALWVSVSLVISVFRMVLWRRFNRRPRADGEVAPWGLAFTVCTTILGCLWGLLAFTVFVQHDSIYFTFAAFVLGGMGAGSAVRDSPHLPAFYGFVIPALSPMAFALVATGQPVPRAMGILLVAFEAVLVLLARENSERLAHHIRLEIEQESLNANLRQTTLDLSEEIAERQRITDALEESGERFRAIGDQALDAIIISDVNGKVVYWNAAAEHTFGYTESEILGQNANQCIIPERDRKGWNERLADFAPTGQGDVIGKTVPLLALRKDGTEIPIEVSFSIIKIGGVPHVLGINRDISERWRNEREIVKLNEQLTSAVAILRRREHSQTIIANLSDTLQSCRSGDEAYPIISRMAAQLFQQTSGILASANEQTLDVTRVAAWGLNQAATSHFLFEDCWALRTGQCHEFDGSDSEAICRHFSRPPGGAYVCLPVMVDGVVRSLLNVIVDPGKQIDDELRQVMRSFGDMVGLSLANINLRETLSDQALRDPLTGLFNRRYLVETLSREVRRAHRSGSPITIAMIDIDHFKQLNDDHGHDAGDMVLSELGKLFSETLRAGDIACRYGGEEFLIVLPDCDLADGRQRLSQISSLAKAKPHIFRGQPLPPITLSIGLATARGTLFTGERLITAADKAMYKAKKSGRDRIEAFQPDPS